jgi:hypothetical protein
MSATGKLAVILVADVVGYSRLAQGRSPGAMNPARPLGPTLLLNRSGLRAWCRNQRHRPRLRPRRGPEWAV